MTPKDNPIKSLLSIASPSDWREFVFDLQSELISNGYVGLLTEIGTSDFVIKLQGLHDFFCEIEKQKEVT